MKTKERLIALSLVFSILAGLLCFVACGKTPSGEDRQTPDASSLPQDGGEPLFAELVGGIVKINKYGNITLSVAKDEMASRGYRFGDIVSVSFAGRSADLPYCSGYSDVDAGCAGLFGKEDDETLTLAVNVGNFAAVYGIADKLTGEDGSFEWVYRDGMSESLSFRISMKQQRGYYNEYVIRQLSYTDDRADYPDLSDEEFANFRAVATTGMKENTLYRSGSPIDPSRTRSAYADAAARQNGIGVILDLTDGEAALAAYENYEETYFASVRHIALSMGMDYTEDDFKEKLRDGLRFMIANEGVYLVHCKEGKDRTGFVVALLEFLLGATYEEAEADYMLTYRNYYGVTAGEERYDIIVSSNFEKILKRSFGVDEVKSADLAELAAGYIGSSGLTDEEISALKANLSAG